jgi:transmembrane sensor
LDAIETPASGQRTLDLDDGSRVRLDPKTRLAPLENTSHSVVFLLGSGRASFDVRPGGPRRWSIEAGLATVEVVGTRFTVSRTQTQVTVEVERGVVLVRGERVPDRVQRLEAGGRLQIDQEPPAAALSASPSPSSAIAPPAERARVPRDEGSWQDLAKQGEYGEAYRSLGADGIAAQTKTASLDQLLTLADVARFSGHPTDAVEPLRRVVREHGRDPRAALAAFTLGRVHLDSLGDPAQAARDFRDSISLELPEALLEDAHLRLIEARAKAGDQPGAHQAWEAYVQRFSDSPRRAVADRWGGAP